MKHIVKNKKDTFKYLTILFFFIILLILIIPTNKRSKKQQEVFNPIKTNEEYVSDLTGDGQEDKLAIISKSDYSDILITSDNKNYYLSNLCENNILASNNTFSPLDVYIKNLSRNNHPEILVQGMRNGKPINYIFTWSDNKFVKLLENNNNLLGVLDYSTNKTPRCFVTNSSNSTSSFLSYMIINDELLDISKDTDSPVTLDLIQSFIDLVQTPYELESIPNIFKEDISSDELALLWNLDKESNNYSFQNGVFYDEHTDNNGNITTVKWRLNFEKYIKEKDDSYKSQLTICVNCDKTTDNSYKISSFYIS